MDLTTNPYEHLLSVEECMRITGRTRQAITRAIRAGRLPAYKSGPARTSPYFVDPLDLRRVYPPKIRSDRPQLGRGAPGRPRARFTQLTGKQLDEAIDYQSDQ